MLNQKESRLESPSLLILSAAVGVVCIVGYFVLVTTSPVVNFLKPRVSKDEILSLADAFYRTMPIDHEQSDRDIAPHLDKNLLEYVQYFEKKNNRYPDLVPGYWSVVWGTGARGEHERRGGRFFEVRYDFNGNMIGFTDNMKPQGNNEIVFDADEDDALFEARYFLGEHGIKADTLTMVNREIRKRGNKNLYTFLLENSDEKYPGLLMRYTVELLGNRVITYRLDRMIAKRNARGFVRRSDSALSYALLTITWLTVFLTLIVRFVKKLRKDELEFKRALWVGAFLGVVVLLVNITGATHGGKWWELLLGGGFSGAMGFLGMLLLFPTSESQTRAAWPEKLTVIDLLFQGRVSIKETGAAILRSFFLTGSTLLVLGLLIRFATGAKIGYVSFRGSMMEGLQSLASGGSVILNNIIITFFIGFVLLFFWPAFLKEKVPNTNLFLFFLAVTLSLGGMQFLFFNPLYVALPLMLPIALGWAYIVYRFDLLTVILLFMGTKFSIDISLVFLVPGALSGVMGLSVVIFAIVVFLAGVYLVFRPVCAEDYDSYVPEYVSRIAERERLVRELEIARSVQMRFLPQDVPEFAHLDIVSLCQPAMEVGGDYYDFVRMDETNMSVLIGDVSGKGVSAAFYMTMVKGIIKTLSRKTRQPAVLLEEANEIFCENAPRDVFVTVIYGVFNLEEQALTFASAGHNPLIVWRKNTGTAQMLNPRGIALGLARGAKYHSLIEETTIPFEEGDVFVFYTDGVSESMNMNQEIFGEERLMEVVAQSGHQPPRLIQRNVVEAVSRFSGKAPQHDDFTMVVVKIK